MCVCVCDCVCVCVCECVCLCVIDPCRDGGSLREGKKRECGGGKGVGRSEREKRRLEEGERDGMMMNFY